MLVLQDAEGRQFEFPAGAEVITLGRAPGNPLVLPQAQVSALHGQISRRGGGYYYQDLNSTNGSALERGGRRRRLGGEPVLLQTGDVLYLGGSDRSVTLTVMVCRPTAATSQPATCLSTRPLEPAGELGERLQRRGTSLLGHLRLSEQLGLAADVPAACAALEDFLRQAGAGKMVLLEGRSSGGPRLLYGQQPSEPLPEPTTWMTGRYLLRREGAAHLFLPLGVDGRLLLELALPAGGEERLDEVLLAARLFELRLEQIAVAEKLRQAQERLLSKNRYLREQAQARESAALVGDSPAMKRLREQIRQVALSDATVLITGPSGSGKELVAREIHRQSLRHADIFAAVNCGALPEGLLEAELFGSRRGAFTGAVRDREGLFAVADRGTLFLDEIGEMSPAAQVKLLRVLETGEILPLGDNRPQRVDVRIIAASNRDLEREVERGRFRQDLYYRLAVFPIRVPSLEERREDIPQLVAHFLQLFGRQLGRPALEVSRDALDRLGRQAWPGNVRQLANRVQRALLLCEGGRLEAPHFGLEEEGRPAETTEGPLKERLARLEREIILRELERQGGNRSRTARSLGLTRQALLVKMRRLGMREEEG